MKKHFILLAVLVLIAGGILYALNKNSGAANRTKNGFTRTYAAKQPVVLQEKDFKVDFYALAGVKGDTLFLTGMRPDQIYVTTIKLDKLDTINLNLPEIKYLTPAFYTTVLYPNFYIIGANSRMLIKGNVLTGNADTIKINLGGIVSNPVVIGKNRFISRVIENKTRNAVFKAFDSTGKEITSNPGLEETLADAGFTNDGSLSYDKSTGHLAYVTYYLNKVTLFDTNLNLVKQAQSLDTNRTTKFELKKTATNVTHQSPPLMINTYSQLSNGSLYVKSKLEADNESKEFENASVIDRFDSNGNYMGSFYLIDPLGGRLISFYTLNNNYIITLNKSHLSLYRTD